MLCFVRILNKKGRQRNIIFRKHLFSLYLIQIQNLIVTKLKRKENRKLCATLPSSTRTESNQGALLFCCHKDHMSELNWSQPVAIQNKVSFVQIATDSRSFTKPVSLGFWRPPDNFFFITWMNSFWLSLPSPMKIIWIENKI